MTHTTRLSNPRLVPLVEEPNIDRDMGLGRNDVSSQCGSPIGSSKGGSHVGSLLGSQISSALTDSKQSVFTGGNFSAFTAPPRYRNSGAFVHGTRFRNFQSIMTRGLRAANSDIFMIDEVRPDGRVPGLSNPPEILIFIDEIKARSENMEFEYDASQGTWKTKGIGGVIRPWFFQKVVDQRKGPCRGNVLFQSKEDPMMQANLIRGPQRPSFLIHATYWENVFGIMKEGIVPAKNPVSDIRRPFKELLQGAESHVYTVNSGAALRKRSPLMSSPTIPSPTPARRTDPEVVPEEEESSTSSSTCKHVQDVVGLERPPDAFFVIDTQKAESLGMSLELVQSADREETIFVQGPVPRELLASAEPNDPVNLPENLKAKIVDPRSFDDLPIIDLSLDEPAVVEKMRYACEVVGFMQVVGHGVSLELQERHMELQKTFFALPQERKVALALGEKNPVRGYFGRGGEDLDQVQGKEVDLAGSKGQKLAQWRQAKNDNKEALDLNGVSWSKPKGGYVANIFKQPSQFPAEEELPGFQKVFEEYAAEMFRISTKLLQIMALVLGKPRNFFDKYLTAPVATHRLLHYWPIKDFNTQIGVGEHTDYGLLTVLKQDTVGGLQVLNAKDGKWVHACPVHNAFVVNLGDMLGRWSGHRFKSTIHRVVNVSTQDRYSVPYFLEPNMDTVIVEGALCESAPSMPKAAEGVSEHQRRCQLRKNWDRVRGGAAKAEVILERFYRASGQLKHFAPAPRVKPSLNGRGAAKRGRDRNYV